jgi:hypothetical protein
MICAENLMLNDYVIYEGQICKIYTTGNPSVVRIIRPNNSIVHLDFDTEYLSKILKPVKLTKELLEKNSFTLVENCTSKWSFVDKYGNTIIISGSCDGALRQSITIYTNSSSVANGYYKVVSDFPVCALHDVQHLLKQLHIKKSWVL